MNVTFGIERLFRPSKQRGEGFVRMFDIGCIPLSRSVVPPFQGLDGCADPIPRALRTLLKAGLI